MKKTWRKIVVAAGLSAAAFLTGTVAQAQDCQPGYTEAYQLHRQVYSKLKNKLTPEVNSLDAELKAVVDQASYEVLLAHSHTIAGLIPNGRLLVTIPDGTVVLDTSKPDDPNNQLPQGNSYDHFKNKTVNENHNSRVAIFSAQLFPCGLGLETKFSTTDNQDESYYAIRLGVHLDSDGTARISTKQ